MSALAHCVCANLRRATRAVTTAYARALLGTGLNPTQFTTLQELDARGPIAQGQLAETLAIDSATLTHTLAPLARRGWIRSERGTDRRQRCWQITMLGLRRLFAASHPWRLTQEQLRAGMGDRTGRLLADLDAVTRAARQVMEYQGKPLIYQEWWLVQEVRSANFDLRDRRSRHSMHDST